MNKIAILVVGPESSGIHLAMELCIASGCAGAASDVQPFDNKLPEHDQYVMWGKSIPTNLVFPDLCEMTGQLEMNGYSVKAIVTTREIGAMVSSQVALGRVETVEEARKNIFTAYSQIHRELDIVSVPITMLPYEALVLHPHATISNLMNDLGIPLAPFDQYPRIYNGNPKHYRNNPKF